MSVEIDLELKADRNDVSPSSVVVDLKTPEFRQASMIVHVVSNQKPSSIFAPHWMSHSFSSFYDFGGIREKFGKDKDQPVRSKVGLPKIISQFSKDKLSN